MTRRPISAGIRSGGPAEDDDQRSRLREALARWPSGVAVVAARDAELERPHGLTVSAFCSVSLDPPLVLVCLFSDTPVLSYLRDTGRFTISLLTETQRRLAGIFADRFPAGALPFPPDGDPVVEGAAASLVCTVHATHPGGDHEIVIGHVERVVLGPDQPPLLYYAREYRGLR